jgi:cytochrome c-type biogenesis protein CcmH
MRALLAALLVACCGLAFGQADEVAHPDAKVEQRLKDLGSELRCLVCQNETIAVSQAPLALDLRNEIRAMIRQGRSDDEIRAYLVARYGDFVLYKPPFKPVTALLWIGPFALLLAGAAVAVVVVRRRGAAAPARRPGVDAERAAIAALLEGEREAPRPATRKP